MENMINSHKNIKFRISAPTWNDKFELPDGLYSIPNIQYCFEHKALTNNLPMK